MDGNGGTAPAEATLSDRQRAILDFVKRYIAEHGYPPAMRNIRDGCGISSTSVVLYNLGRLQDKGFIHRDLENARAIRVAGDVDPAVFRVPVAGTIAAGAPFPLLVSPGPDAETIAATREQAGGCAAARAVLAGDGSMAGDLIGPGDRILLDPGREYADGETVAVQLRSGNRPAVRRIWREDGGSVRLLPREGACAEPLRADASDAPVHGRLLSVLRVA